MAFSFLKTSRLEVKYRSTRVIPCLCFRLGFSLQGVEDLDVDSFSTFTVVVGLVSVTGVAVALGVVFPFFLAVGVEEAGVEGALTGCPPTTAIHHIYITYIGQQQLNTN